MVAVFKLLYFSFRRFLKKIPADLKYQKQKSTGEKACLSCSVYRPRARKHSLENIISGGYQKLGTTISKLLKKHHIFFLSFLFFFPGHTARRLVESQFPDQGWNPCLLQWRLEALIIRHPGNASFLFLTTYISLFKCLKVSLLCQLVSVIKYA